MESGWNPNGIQVESGCPSEKLLVQKEKELSVCTAVHTDRDIFCRSQSAFKKKFPRYFS